MLYELSRYETMTLQDACVAAQCRAEENAESAERCANSPNMPEAERARLLSGWHKAVGRSSDWAEHEKNLSGF